MDYAPDTMCLLDVVDYHVEEGLVKIERADDFRAQLVRAGERAGLEFSITQPLPDDTWANLLIAIDPAIYG